MFQELAFCWIQKITKEAPVRDTTVELGGSAGTHQGCGVHQGQVLLTWGSTPSNQ